ncbi:MAG: DNA polymerase III subunit delta' [Candidatus Peregrinibacteria bacterium Greene0416_62]|nr:MAG: DNA polymerase III subunit delta' [Candidatus Peregrinibacteria bacterium Greene0416_62]TSC97797.1 MAG: DNA polymerase III subunit delta' [Candidatus Peregrinibacteria bacterium Greene1014_49]
MPRIPETIVGHEEQHVALLSDIASNNVSHAYLFHGPKHLGKMTMALWFARELLRVGKDPEQCALIEHEIERLTHPDLFVLDQLWMEGVCEDWNMIAKSSNVSQGHRKKDGAKTDVISIEDIRELHRLLHEKGLSRYRCCIIRSAERMQPSAGNALLKILEEPPAGLVFILTAASQSTILPTIVSRSRTLSFHRVPEPKLLSMIPDADKDDQQFILSLAQGAPGVVHSLSDDPDALRAHRLLKGKAVAFWQARALSDRLQHLAPLLERGEEADQLLLHLSLTLRENTSRSPASSHALLELLQGLKTNAHRQIMVQRFAVEVG